MSFLAFSSYEYLLVLLLCLSVPVLLSVFNFANMHFFYKKILLTTLVVSIPWLVWDVFATYRGHWGFNQDYLTGLKIVNLPFEEVAFFVVIPYCCLFMWVILRKKLADEIL